jgi:hypothetical protein
MTGLRFQERHKVSLPRRLLVLLRGTTARLAPAWEVDEKIPRRKQTGSHTASQDSNLLPLLAPCSWEWQTGVNVMARRNPVFTAAKMVLRILGRNSGRSGVAFYRRRNSNLTTPRGWGRAPPMATLTVPLIDRKGSGRTMTGGTVHRDHTMLPTALPLGYSSTEALPAGIEPATCSL